MLLRDPLIHFLAAGAVLFLVFAWRHDDADPEQIRISGEQVEQIARSAALREGREPTREELDGLVEAAVRDEVYYREALALGLDENDDEVHRRLVDKMRYLTENLADPEPPSAEALEAYYAADPGRFEIPAAVTFDQVFFSPGERGDALAEDVDAALAALEGGADPAGLGDRTPLDSRLTDAPRARVEVLFGTALTDAVFTAEPGRWLGPFESDFGTHLVRVVSRSAARIPPYAEIEEQVRSTYAAERRAAANESAYQQIRDHYEIVVDWPDASTPADGSTPAGTP